MKKILSLFVIALYCVVYITWRIQSNVESHSWASWALVAAELIIVSEIAFYLAASLFKSDTIKKVTNKKLKAVSVLDIRNSDEDAIDKSLYALEKSEEITSVYIIHDLEIDELDRLIKSYSKVNSKNITDVKFPNSENVLWVNAGDIVFENTVSISANYLNEETCIAVPGHALWSNSINGDSNLQNYDRFDHEITSFISQKNGFIFTGETALISGEFFASTIAENIGSKDLFSIVASSLKTSSQKCSYIPIIAVERHLNNSTTEVNSRTNEIRQSMKSMLKFKWNLANLRNASRPFRSLAIVGVSVVAINSTISNTSPFATTLGKALGVGALFYLTMGIVSFLHDGSKEPHASHIHHAMKNFGSDISCLFTTNSKINRLFSKHFGTVLAVGVSASMFGRIVANRANNTPQGVSAASIVFAMTVLSVLLYGLELVGFKQRRKSLRRNVIINAKIENDAVEITDLSPKDLGMIAKSPIAVGEIVCLTLSVPRGDTFQEISLNARVVNSTSKGISHRMGCVFENIDSNTAEILNEFCMLTYPQSILNGIYEIRASSAASNITIPKKITRKSLSFIGNDSMKPLVRAAAIVALVAIAIGNLPPYSNAQAAITDGTAGTVAGYVFQDFDLDGVKDAGDGGSATDVGLEGVKVVATCTDGQTKPATSDKNGRWIISGIAGSCRVSVDTTTIPTGMQSAQIGSDSNSLVQFVSSGKDNIAFNLGYPGDFCQANPAYTVNCFGRGGTSVLPANKGSVLKGTWKGETHNQIASFGKVGTTYGLAYKKDTQDIFASAYLRRKTSFGPLGIDGVYKISSNNAVTNWLKLGPVTGEDFGADPHVVSADPTELAFRDYEAQKYVGRRGIGDIDMSTDSKTLYATNLNTRSVYAIDANAGTLIQKRSFLGLNLPTTSGRKCADADVRIFGLGVKANGDVYIGAVCSAESSNSRADLMYYVFKSTDKLGSTPILVSSGSLDFQRETDTFWGYTNNWNPWTTTYADTVAEPTNFGTRRSHPEAMLSDIAFDGKDLVLGFRDRFGDTLTRNDVTPQDDGYLASQGDLLRACSTSDPNNFVMENNRTCGGNTASGAVPAPVGDVANGGNKSNGPGGGEWFAGEDPIDSYAEGAIGSIGHASGFKEFAATQADPEKYMYQGQETQNASAGIRWFNSASGLATGDNNTIYDQNDSDWNFAKAAGIGDLEILCDEAPVEIGNRVWVDDNSNGVQDAGEAGLGGAKVELLNASGTVISTANTDANGSYKFAIPTKNVTYSVRVDMTTTSGLIPTASDLGNNDTLDSDGTINGNYLSVGIPALGSGQNNHTFDFGFVPVYSLGNKVFEDKNNNGVFDSNDTPIANVAVKLLDGNGVAIAGKTTTTDANGHYYFPGLIKGDYIVEVTTPAGLVSSSGTNGSLSGTYEPAPDPDGTPKLDSDDNGTKFDGTATRSKPISLGTNVPSGEDQGNVVNLPDSRNDYTVDFGFFRPGSLGDKVWLDADKDGIQDSSETAVSNVNVTLYQNACGANGIVLGTTTTDANGNYSFGNLVAGNYFVKFTLPNGMEWTVKGAGSNTAVDSNVNESTGCSDVVALPYGGNDPTIDAGIKTPIVPIDLAVVKSITNKPAAPNTFKPGDTVDYKLVVTNKGPGTAMSGYSVLDILPAGLTYIEGSAAGTGYACTNVGQTLTCVSDHALAPNVNETITLKAKIASTFSSPTASLRNVTVVKPNPNDVPETIPEPNCLKNADGTYKDPTDVAVCNNVDTEEFPLPIDLVIQKSITNLKSPSFLPGDDVNYKLEITNNGPATAIAGFTVTDVLPAELTYKGTVTGNGYACVITGKTVVCTSDHALPINVKDTITFTATISATLGNNTQSIVNVATVKPNPNDPSPETIPFPNCDPAKPGVGLDGKTCNNVDPEGFPLPKGASLGDFVFYDTDHDGFQDAGEKGVSGVKVELHDTTCAGTKLAETTTDADGKYLFANLTPGKSYVVKFIAPDGTVLTVVNLAGDDSKDSDAESNGCTTPVVLGDGEFNPTIDAGIYKPWASIGDFVWLDTDKDGVQDSGEAGVPNVSVSLIDANGTVVKTMVTGADGKYLFANLEPGDYSIAFVIPGGYSLSPKDNGDNAKDSDAANDGKTVKTTLDPGENDLTWDMGIYVTPAELGDYVWYDDNNDGKQDADEKPVVGVRVLLYGEACGVGAFLKETTTDANGLYKFDNLAPGKYTVKFILPDGTSFTLPNNVADDAKDSDASANGCSPVVTLNPGDKDTTIDAGIVKLASLGDYVWLDLDRDGIQDANEVGVQGVHVLLLDKDGNAIPGKELVTDKDGKYLFTGLLPGTYSVQFVKSTLPVGYTISDANKGNDDAKDSDGNVDNGKTASVTLKAGDQNLTLDLGINPIPAKLGDKVFEDKDKDGVQDPNEPGIKGVKVELYRCEASGTDAPIATVTTDANGNYLFDNLEAGSYVVKFYGPDGMVVTKSYQGGSKGLDSDAGTDGRSACIKLNPGDDDRTIDAGYYTPDKPVEVLPNVISRPQTLPFTGSESMQLAAFAGSLIGAGILAVGFVSRKKRRPGMSWY